MSKRYEIENIEANGKQIQKALTKLAKVLVDTPKHEAIIAMLSAAILMEAPDTDMEDLSEMVYEVSAFITFLITGEDFDDDDDLILN